MPIPKSARPSAKKSQLSERIEILEQKLPERFDALNEAITEAEVYLRSLKPVEPVWYEFRQHRISESIYVSESIGFCKYNGKWRVMYFAIADNDDPSETPMFPLTDRTMETRVYAAPHIPKLRELIVESKEEFISKVDESIAILKSLSQGK